MRLLLVSICFALFVLPTSLRRAAEPQAREDPGGAPAVIIPALTLEAGSALEVQIVFRNRSGEALKYLPIGGDVQVGFLKFSLFKDGERVPLRMFVHPPPATPHHVRELRSHDQVLCTLKLRDWYGDLKAGQYELVISYQVSQDDHLNKLGMTPMSLKERLQLHIE